MLRQELQFGTMPEFLTKSFVFVLYSEIVELKLDNEEVTLSESSVIAEFMVVMLDKIEEMLEFI
jgi:hypothetical protein